jgi:tetratricopeptide (TPR) repeat protein
LHFLERLKTLLPDKNIVKTGRSDLEMLLEDLQALKDSIMERIEAIENGDYETLDDWDWEDAHYDDEPEMISSEQMNDLSGFFDEAGYLFLNGEFQDSRTLYQALFDLLEELGESNYSMPDLGVHIREERARYARCVYETSDGNERLVEFADAMDLKASSCFDKQKIDNSYPLLQDVMDAGEQDMKDIQDFYPLWEKILKEKGIQGRPASLLTEVVCFTKGLAGVEELAREWGDIQPFGYLFWLDKLRQEKQWDDIIEIAKDALMILKTGSAREEVSDVLAEAGQMTNAPAVVLKGKLEKFYSRPCDANLKLLLTEAVKQDQREESLTEILDFYTRQRGLSDGEKSLYLKILLLTGNLDKAWEFAKKAKSLGWSYGSAAGLVFGSINAVAADFHENAGTIRRLLAWYGGESSIYSYQFSVEEEDQPGFFYAEIIKGLMQTQFQPSRLKQYTDWAFQIGRERVDGIVSNTHRSAYQRAALVLGSLAEVYAAQGNAQKAQSLIHEFCKEKYNRHTAFKREVKKMIGESLLLRQLGKLI